MANKPIAERGTRQNEAAVMVLKHMTRLSYRVAVFGFLLGVGACSEPECQRGELKIGNRCVDIRRSSDAGPDIEEGETLGDAATASADSAASTARDTGVEDDASAEGRPNGADAEVRGDAADPRDHDASTTPSCVAEKEVCDDDDNDCDGKTDEGVMNACGGCGEIVPDHAPKKPCDNDGEGICAKSGEWVCHAGTTVCSAPDPTPTEEICDGKDNDCDGVADNGVTKNSCGGCDSLAHAKNDSCDNGLDGECRVAGKYICSADLESTSCDAPKKSGSAEICDNKDNDCNGQVDDGATCTPPAECVTSACASGSCANTPKAKGVACATGQCDGAGKCGFCGDGSKNGIEQCDPKAPYVGTFLCSPECASRKLYTSCVPDDPSAMSGPSSQCDNGDRCGVERFCSPTTPSGTAANCPVLDGPYRQLAFFGSCVIACNAASDCPSLVGVCKPNTLATPYAGYCVRQL